jgi:hypothetical protein
VLVNDAAVFKPGSFETATTADVNEVSGCQRRRDVEKSRSRVEMTARG